MSTLDLFDTAANHIQKLGKQAFIFHGYALPYVKQLLAGLAEVKAAAPYRYMVTPGGLNIASAKTNCGILGWTSNRAGYKYSHIDPETKKPWPPMPDIFSKIAIEAAEVAGFIGFAPDACLINQYLPGAKLSLHQDKNELDYTAPVVSISLGMQATFLFGGLERTEKPIRVSLHHGDVAVWGGEDRLRYHGVLPLKSNPHPLLGNQRISITLRKAG